MQGTEERIRELQDRATEITQFEQQTENRKNSRVSEIYGMETKDLTSVLSESKKGRRNMSRPKRYAKK